MLKKTTNPTPAKLLANWLFPHSRPVVKPGEVEFALAMSDEQVRAHVDQGNFVAAPINDQPAMREHLRIMRWSVEAWWLNQLEDKGTPLQVGQTQEVTWWRGELRRFKAGSSRSSSKP